MRGACRLSVAVTAVVLGLCTSACSVSYVDERGVRRVVGFVDMAISPPDASQAFAGSVVDTTTYGLSVSRAEHGGHVALGYNRETMAALRDHALVLGAPLRVRECIE